MPPPIPAVGSPNVRLASPRTAAEHTGLPNEINLLAADFKDSGERGGEVGAGAGDKHSSAGMLGHFSPQKAGSRSNPNERMLIPSYVHMTQPSEPTRSPSKVPTALMPDF